MRGGRVEQRLAQAFVDLHDMDVAHPLGEILGEDAQPTTDLQDHVRGLQPGCPVDHPKDVRVDQEVLAQVTIGADRETPHPAQAWLAGRLGHGAHAHANSRAAFRSTAPARASGETPLSSATKASVWATKAGWLRCLRTGWGVR